MFDMKCVVCGGGISLDQQRTINSYMSTMDYVVSKDGELDMNTIQGYMYYKCKHCDKTYKYTIRDVEREVRRGFAEEAMLIRGKEVFSNNKNEIEEDSVISYCGKCRGQDGKGNCFSILMRICPIRNNK